MSAPIKIKFLARTFADQDPALWLSLFPGRDPHIGPCVFDFDPESREYDWLVVYEDLTFLPGSKRSERVETLACAKENTLFITTEPTSIKLYGPGYLGQFGHVLTRQPAHIVRHNGHIQETPALRWYYGRPLPGQSGHHIDVDRFQSTPPLIKSADVSSVCSDKQMTPTLKLRYDFNAAMRDALGDQFDWFGRGIRPIADKSEAMDSYRYHLAIENHVEPHHWTEKIADCFLAYCLPLYYGAPNIGDYFPKQSFIPIDITDPQKSAHMIQESVSGGEYEKRLPAIIDARNRVLTQYNLMNQIARTVQARHTPAKASKTPYNIYGRHAFRKARPVKALGDLVQQVRFH